MRAIGWGRIKAKYLSSSCDLQLVKDSIDRLKVWVETADDFDQFLTVLAGHNIAIQAKSGTLSIWIYHAPGCHKIRVSIRADDVIFEEERQLNQCVGKSLANQ